MITSSSGLYFGVPFEQILEILRYAVSLLSALTAALPFWSRFEATKGERWAFGAAAAVIAFLLWPTDFSYCKNLPNYRSEIAVFLAIAAIAGLAYFGIHRQYGHTQWSREDELGSARPILGGPVLAHSAREMRVTNPTLSTQQIFEALHCDPLRTWERWPRTWLLILHRFCAMCAPLGVIAAIVAALAGFVLFEQTLHSHVPLTIDPTTDQAMLAGRSLAIVPNMRECIMTIDWSIEGLSKEKSRGALGEVSQTGTYSAPSPIEEELELYVVATPVQHPDERKKLKIQLRQHPAYGSPHPSRGEDPKGKHAEFVIEVLDKSYSWIIGEYALQGVDGPTLARRMASDGLFSGFQDIICVGAASREYGDKAKEEDRARSRAYVLGSWVRDAQGLRRTRIHALKIGRYDEEEKLPAERTAVERQVVVVGVLNADKEIDLLAALRDAFAKKRTEEPLLGMYLDKYPRRNWELRPIE